jgi:organic hydroperoxide reductase OsmC/OhrA
MSVVKAFRFPVAVQWKGGSITVASAAGKPALEVATPPEFKNGVGGIWSPEDLLVTATASCYAVTLVAISRGRGFEPTSLNVSGTGHVSRRDDGRFGFVAIELDVSIETATADEAAQAERAVAETEEKCLIATALDIPVHVHATVRAAIEAAVA